MSYSPMQIGSRTKGGTRKWLKRERIRKLRYEAKDVSKPSPLYNRYHKWD